MLDQAIQTKPVYYYTTIPSGHHIPDNAEIITINATVKGQRVEVFNVRTCLGPWPRGGPFEPRKYADCICADGYTRSYPLAHLTHITAFVRWTLDGVR